MWLVIVFWNKFPAHFKIIFNFRTRLRCSEFVPLNLGEERERRKMNFGDKHRSYSSFGVCAELSARGWLDHSFDRPEFNIQYRDSCRGGGSSITGRRRGMGGIPPPTWRAPATNWKLIMEAFARARTPPPLPSVFRWREGGGVESN